LDEVWLYAEGCEQSKIELQTQPKRIEELMRNCEVATKDMVPTPITQGGCVPNIPLPDGALISDDDDSFISSHTESGEVSLVPALMMMVPTVLSQMRELKDLTLLLMVKVVVGLLAKLTLLIG
jgi:hypothetical protein